MTNEEITNTLKRLRDQSEIAQHLVSDGLVDKDVFQAFHDTTHTFVIGDFIVTDKRWTTCGPKEQNPPDSV